MGNNLKRHRPHTQPQPQTQTQQKTPLQSEPQSQLENIPQQSGSRDVTQRHYKDRNKWNQVIEKTQQLKKQDLPHSMLLNELKDLERKARDIEAPEKLTEALNDITKTIEDKLNETYEFKGNLFQIGSSVDGTKTGKPDEFDYLYVVNRDSVEYKEHDGHELFCGNKELKASEIAEDFMNKIDTIAAKLDLKNLCLEHGGFACPSYSGCRRNGPAATLLFKTDDRMLISLDFTIAFLLSKRKEMKILSAIVEKAGPLLPQQDKRAKFLKDTLCLVAVEPDKDIWRVSTARLEATFLSKLPKDHCLKIAMRYGKILSKKQVSEISDESNIFYDLGPENVVTTNLANYRENRTAKRLHELKNAMRLTHYYLRPFQGQLYSELTSSHVKLDSASIKHLALRIVCKDRPKLADAKGEEPALIIASKIMEELANPNVYKVENYLYKHEIKMVCIAMYAAPMFDGLTWYAKKRCEQFLTDNGLAPEITLPVSQEQPQPLKGITEDYPPDAYIAGRDSNTTDTVLSQTTTRLNKNQYSGRTPEERMKRLATATKQSRMDQRVTELTDYVVPFDKRDCPEHTFLVRFTKDELIAKDYPVIGKITNALLNAIGGILILKSTDTLTESERKRCTDYIERLMSEKIAASIHFKPSPSGMIMFIPKSKDPMLYNGCIITRSQTGNEHNLDYDSLVAILNRKSDEDHYLQMNPSYGFDDKFRNEEGQNREYKHWEVKSFRDIINHIAPCPHQKHQRAPKNVCYKESNTIHQEAAKTFRQTLLAMANEPRGGEVIIGIAKLQGKFFIKGLHLEDADRGDFEDVIDEVLKKDPVTGEPRVWREPGRCPEKNTHWRVSYHYVFNTPGDERRVIARIQIDHYPGGVFEVEPVAYDVDQDGYITQKTFSEWRERMERNIPKIPITGVKINSRPEAKTKSTKTPDSVDPETMNADLMKPKERLGTKDKPTQSERLDESPNAGMNNTETQESVAKVNDGTSYVKTVDPETMNAALMDRKELSWTKDKLSWDERLEKSHNKTEEYTINDPCFALNEPPKFTPPKETVLRRHPFSDVKINEIEKYHKSDNGFVICVESWMSHLMEETIPENHLTDLLVFVQKEGTTKGSNFHELHLWVICGTAGDQKDNWEYAIQTSLSLKHRLIEIGCPGISVICHTLSGDYRICSVTSGHQEEIMEHLYSKSEETIELVKKTICKILFQEDLYFTNRVGNRALINLTEEQAKTLFMSVSSKITFIRGPPGSGKTILAMCIAKRYDPTKVIFICTTESFKEYISVSMRCGTYFVKSGTVEQLKKWIQSEGIKNIECFIFDDVHNLECTKDDWYTILVQLVKSRKGIHLFADPDIQAYGETNSVKYLRDAFNQIEDDYKVIAYQHQLTDVHRNTRKVTAFIKDASSSSPVGIQMKAANSLDGDDIETLYRGGLRLEGADNDLVVLIQGLTLVYPPHDIAVLLGGEKAVEDKNFYTKVLSQHLDCEVHGADQHPPKGVQVDVVDEYLGLDAPVVIHMNSKPTPTTQIDNPKYRSFIASRGIFRVIFLVDEPLTHQDYKWMNLDKPLAESSKKMDQRVTELADYVVPFDKRDCPEHTFLVRFTEDELIAKDYPVIGKITNALLNAIGGILILESTDGELNEKEWDAWHRSCTDYLERFMSEKIVRSIHFKPSQSGMIMFIPKSQNLMLYNGCIITRSPSGNEENLDYDSLDYIMNRKSEENNHVMMNPSYYFDDEFLHREGQYRKYKHWEVTSFGDIINHIAPGSNTKYQEAAEVFCQTLLAMANEPCSGEVIIGIAELQEKFFIKGMHLEDWDRGDFEDVIDDILKYDPVTREPRVWREPGRFPEKNTHWRVSYHDVIRTPGNERRVIARIQIDHYPGGVFAVEPVAYDIDQDGYITQKPFAEWREGLTIPTSPVTEVKTKAESEVIIPTIPVTGMKTEAESEVEVEDYVTSDSCFDLKSPLNFTPPRETVLRRHPFSDVKIKEIEKYHQSDRGFVICVRSWMSYLMVETIPYDHVTDLLVFVQKEGINKGSNVHELHLWVICGTAGDQKDDWHYAIQTSLSLKHRLIEGGCTAISVICHTLHDNHRRRSSGHQEETTKYLYTKSEETVKLVKKTLAKILSQKDLYLTNRVVNRALINLTEEQAESLFMGELSPITLIQAPPGSGKTILAMCIAKRYDDPKKVVFICTTESFEKYITFSAGCGTYFVKSGTELKKWIQSEGIGNIECLIFDDVRNLECTRDDWYTILEQLVRNGKNIHLFADPDIQAYKETNSMEALKQALRQIEDEYDIAAYRKQLTEVHRNTRKVTAFIIDAVSSSTPTGGIQFKAAPTVDGDGIETMYRGALRLEGADNDLVVLIQELTLDYPPCDIAVLLGGEKAVEDKDFYTEVLRQHLDCKVHGADHHPKEGVQVDVVDEYLGLDAPVVIHLNSKPTPVLNIDNPKYKCFIASRGIFRVIFLVEEHLTQHDYE